MLDYLLKSRLSPVTRRHRRILFLKFLVQGWLMALAVLLVLAGILYFAGVTTGWAGVAAVLVGAGGLVRAWWKSELWDPDYPAVAREVENARPEFGSVLVTAVDQVPAKDGSFHFLQKRVISQAMALCDQMGWDDSIGVRSLRLWRIANIACLVVLGLSLASLGGFRRVSSEGWVAEGGIEVSPGDVRVERGSGLVVMVRFPGKAPAEAALIIENAGKPPRRMALSRHLKDPVFGGNLPEVDADLRYRIEYPRGKTRDFSVGVYEHPRVERIDVTVTPPAYAGLREETIDDVRRVSALEGSRIQLRVTLNKPVREGRWTATNGPVSLLEKAAGTGAVYTASLSADRSATWSLALVDAEGLTNKFVETLSIDALPNKRPDMKLTFPRADPRVSPLEEIQFEGEFADDFGLGKYGLGYTTAGGDTRWIDLGNGSAPREKKKGRHLLALEELGLQTDQVLSYFLWADDTGPDGKVRRTQGDLFFAEIRPFDEIYRAGDPSAPGAEGAGEQQGEEEDELLDLQRQILSGTWNLMRRAADQPKGFAKDAGVLKDSQKQALKQARALAEKAEDPRQKEMVDQVIDAMSVAADRLGTAESSGTGAALPEAVSAEQKAYQGLLRMGAKEFRVTRNRNSSQGGGGRQKQQRQLNELEFNQEESPYATSRQASQQPQQKEEQRQNLQALSRLKELAQRQQDLNEQMRQLESSLRLAANEEQKEEIRRRLKRLREEQQEILNDLDQMRQTANQQKSSTALNDVRKELDETRKEAQKASESLQEESIPEALASGAKAQRALQKARDDVRKKTSSEFADDMRELRQESRQLAEKEKEIASKLEAMNNATRKRLNDSDERKALSADMARQQSALTNVLGDMRRISEAAEAAEPLLSKQLYDALRGVGQKEPEKALGTSAQLLERGFVTEARRAEEKARQTIDTLKGQVDKAAERLLGDELESLKYAQQQLDRATRELAREADRGLGTGSNTLSNASRGGRPGNGENQTNQLAAGRSPGGENRERGARDGQQGQEGQQASASSRGGETPARQPGEQPGAAQTPGQGEGRQMAQAPGQGQQPGQQGQPGRGQRGQQGQQAQGRGQGQGQGEGEGEGQGQGQGQGQASTGQPGAGGQQASRGQGGEQPQPGGGSRGGGAGGRRLMDAMAGGNRLGGGAGGSGPLTGTEFNEWLGRLGELEEVVDIPQFREDLARVREEVRNMRSEFKRHGREPQWGLVQSQVIAPLLEMRDLLAQEIARRQSPEAMVPIDRDPVPPNYAELVRKYYEELGRGRP